MASAESAARHPIVELARGAVEAFVREDRLVEPSPLPDGLPDRAGVFVTLMNGGTLRGCVGSVEPTQGTLAEEVVRSALLAATDDPRFLPVRPDELEQLCYEVSVLEPPEPVESIDELDPATYGVVVESGSRRGLLLPAVQGVDTAEDQVAIARRKAGIPASAEVKLFRFRTEHFV
jgi:AmmeMemoRadiSam system protein A